MDSLYTKAVMEEIIDIQLSGNMNPYQQLIQRCSQEEISSKVVNETLFKLRDNGIIEFGSLFASIRVVNFEKYKKLQ